MASLAMFAAAGPAMCKQTAVAGNVLAPPALSLEQVLQMQDAEIAEYSKNDFQERLWAALEAAGPEAEHKTHARQELCLPVQVPIVGRLGFEPTQLGVAQAARASMEHDTSEDVIKRNAVLVKLLNPKPLRTDWVSPEVLTAVKS
eukprot:TRINITY_DN38228_c0_g1_i1.p1 TRINITY_DN38228_c0_g1~~TRINITY_DN38228_c0_g1_i1.p1  ORF type:complete len:160 (+),score=38.15 TRINITY_DN38228_c0_g1_i1:46-480(+)